MSEIPPRPTPITDFLETYFFEGERGAANPRRLPGMLKGGVVLPPGTGVRWNDGHDYRVRDTWLNIEHHGDNPEGVYVYVEKVQSEDLA